MADRTEALRHAVTDHESVAFLQAVKPLLLGGLAKNLCLEAPAGRTIVARRITRTVTFDETLLMPTGYRIHDYPSAHDTVVYVNRAEIFLADDREKAARYGLELNAIGVMYKWAQVGKHVTQYVAPIDLTSFHLESEGGDWAMPVDDIETIVSGAKHHF